MPMVLWRLLGVIHRINECDERKGTNYVNKYLINANKIAISKRFDNRNMYTERPGVILNNLKINNKNLVPTTGEK